MPAVICSFAREGNSLVKGTVKEIVDQLQNHES